HPGAATSPVGPLVLGPTDELLLNSDVGGEQLVTVELLTGTSVEVERLFARYRAAGSADPIRLDQLALPDDNTYLNATVSTHGLLPKLSGSTGQFLRGDGTWATPDGGPTTVFDLDWSAEPSSGTLADGPVAVA